MEANNSAEELTNTSHNSNSGSNPHNLYHFDVLRYFSPTRGSDKVVVKSLYQRCILGALAYQYAMQSNLNPNNIVFDNIDFGSTFQAQYGNIIPMDCYDDLYMPETSLYSTDLEWSPLFAEQVYPDTWNKHIIPDITPMLCMIIAESILNNEDLTINLLETSFNTSFIASLDAALRYMGRSLRVLVSGEKENSYHYKVGYYYSQYFVTNNGDLPVLTTKDVKNLLVNNGFVVGGIYALANRSEGRNKTRTQNTRTHNISREPDNDSVRIIRIKEITDKYIRVEIIPHLHTYSDDVAIYRSLPHTIRREVRDLIKKDVHTTVENIDLLDLSVEDSVVSADSNYIIGKISNTTPADFPSTLWLGDEGIDASNPMEEPEVEPLFDPNGYPISYNLTDAELIRTALIQRDFDFDVDLFDKCYGTSNKWFAISIPKVLIRDVGNGFINRSYEDIEPYNQDEEDVDSLAFEDEEGDITQFDNVSQDTFAGGNNTSEVSAFDSYSYSQPHSSVGKSNRESDKDPEGVFTISASTFGSGIDDADDWEYYSDDEEEESNSLPAFEDENAFE